MDWTALCNYCIKVMESASTIFGVSYVFINVLWFIILQPLAILMMFIAYLLQLRNKKKIALWFCIVGIVIVLFIVICLGFTILKM